VLDDGEQGIPVLPSLLEVLDNPLRRRVVLTPFIWYRCNILVQPGTRPS